jgi:hypothetical protein
LLVIENGGFLLIRNFEHVFARASQLSEPKKRARFIATFTILIDPGPDKQAPYAVSGSHLVFSTILDVSKRWDGDARKSSWTAVIVSSRAKRVASRESSTKSQAALEFSSSPR